MTCALPDLTNALHKRCRIVRERRNGKSPQYYSFAGLHHDLRPTLVERGTIGHHFGGLSLACIYVMTVPVIVTEYGSGKGGKVDLAPFKYETSVSQMSI